MSPVSVANMFPAAKRGRVRTKVGKSEEGTPEIRNSGPEKPEIAISAPETTVKRTLRGRGGGESEIEEIPIGVLAVPSRTRSSRSKTPEETEPEAGAIPSKTRSSRNKTQENTNVSLDIPTKTRSSRNKTPDNPSPKSHVPTKTRSARNKTPDNPLPISHVPAKTRSSRNKTPEKDAVLSSTRSSRSKEVSPANLDVPPEKSKSIKAKPAKSQGGVNGDKDELDEGMDTGDNSVVDDPVDCLTEQFETIEIKETVKQLHPSPKLVPSRATRRWNQGQNKQKNQDQQQTSSSLKPPISCPPTDQEVEIVTASTIVTALAQAEDLSRKLTPVEVKEKLSKVGKLADLKVALTGINKAGTKTSTRSTRTSRRNKGKEEEVETEEKEEKKEVSPSYERFHTLSQAVDGNLPLPYTYKLLAEVFRCTDTIMGMLHNRREIATLEKLKKAVQEMTKKDFKESFLKQIKWLFPAGYKYFWEKEMGKFGARKNEYELHVAVNTDYKKDMMEDKSPDNVMKAFVKLGPNMMVERRRIAENCVLETVKKHHQSFCSSLHPPIIVEEDKLLKWHRDFDVDACPEIPQEEFPPKPNVEKLLTAKQVLEKAEQLFNLNPRLSEALVKVADTVEQGEKGEKVGSNVGEKKEEPPKEVKEDPVPKHLKGLNPKLIEKIRAKEAAKAKFELTVDTGAAQKLARYRRLPGLARLIRSVFISEQKAALPLQMVAKKSSECHPGSVTAKDIEEDVREMVKVVAPWPTLHTVREVTYLKINNNIDINQVVEKLENFKSLAEQGKLN